MTHMSSVTPQTQSLSTTQTDADIEQINIEQINLDIGGMTCQACASRIEKVLSKKPAIAQADVNFANETAQIRFDPSQTSVDEILQWVKKTGFEAEVQQADALMHEQAVEQEIPWSLILTWVCLLPFLVGMAGMMVGNHSLMPPVWLQFVLATIVQFGLAIPFYKSAWASIVGRLANMDVLVVLGTLTIWAYSTYIWLGSGILSGVDHSGMSHTVHALPPVYFEAGVMVIAFVRLGKYLEHRTKKHSLNSIQLLVKLIPEAVLVKTPQGEWQSQALSSVKIGEVLLAKAGSRIATDGIVTLGEGWCDESHLTGESVPLSKRIGSTVLAGAMVDNGSFEYRVTATGQQTQLGDMIQALNDAQGSKAKIARLADKVAGVFVPVVVAISIITFVLNYWFLGNVNDALMRAVAVLVIACPCALGLATPAAIMAGMGLAARHGVWFKDAQALEAAGTVDTMVLDKTGTLTHGKPDLVAHYVVDDSLSFTDILILVASVERHANHPLATTLINFAESYLEQQGAKLTLLPATNVQTVAGQGVEAYIEGFGKVKVGRLAFTNVVLPDSITKAVDSPWHIASQVGISINEIPLAAFALADDLMSDTEQVLQRLRGYHIEPMIMSGDKQSVVDYVAHQLQVNQALGELSPRDKAEQVSALQAAGKKVVMVGDGVNDAPAMATATASFAVNNATDIAKHSASARLLGDSLSHAVSAVAISQATLRNIKQNLFFAFIYNCLGIPLAALGLLSPMIAAAAMALSSISVLMNALRLTRFKV
jgi:Cu+-exporting ATPase